MKAWHAVVVGIALSLFMALPALAEIPPQPSRSLVDLMRLFPTSSQLPVGMVLEDDGSRGLADIAATFPDPDDAETVLLRWAWAFNAYQVYVAGAYANPETPARLEISLHQFSNNTGAAYALPYFAHGRAVALGQAEGPVGQLRPCEAAVTSRTEATRYLRSGDLLIRVTAVMQGTSGEQTYYQALAAATQVAYAVLGNTGSSVQQLDRTCL